MMGFWSAWVHGLTSKGTPVNADELPLIDSEAANVGKKLTLTDLKASLKTYFDGLYGTGSGDMLKSTYDTNNNGVVDAATTAGDADTLNGNHASAFATSGHNHSGVYVPVYGVKNANKVFAGPATGADATPDFRALVSADIPALDYMPSTLAKDIVTTAPLTVNGTTNLDNVLPGADADVTFALTQNLPSINKFVKCTILNPNALGITTNTVIPLMITDGALTVTKLECRTSSASYEVAGDLKWADARIGLGSAAVIETFDTTSGVRTDSSIASAAVASGKLLYLQFDSAPNALMTDVFFQVTYDYD